MEKDRILKILLNGNVLSLGAKDRTEIYRLCLSYCASVDDNLGMTIFSNYISGMKAKDISKNVGFNAKELSDYKKDIYGKLATILFNDLNKENNKEISDSVTGASRVFITNRFLVHNMISEKSFNMYCQKISMEKMSEILKNSDFESHINSDILCRFYEKIIGVNIPLGNGYVKYAPGDTIIHIVYSGPSLTDYDDDLPPNGKLTITYIELDPADEEEEIDDPYY